MKKINILITPAGSGMAVAAIKTLKKNKNTRIISTDIDNLAPGLYLSHKGYITPSFKNKNFYSILKKITEKEKIDVILPALDTILLDFSKLKSLFKKKGIEILISEPKTIETTRDKWKTYKELKNAISLPKSFIKKENITIDYPLFIKPRKGSGSENVHKINSKKELEFYYRKIKNPIIQEYLEGKEYTVDCLANKKGDLLVSVPRTRIETKGGISVKGKIIKDKRLENIAKRISDKFNFYGPFFFQIKEDKRGTPKLTEINARIAGTMCFSSFAGVNIYNLAVKLSMGEKIKIPKIKYNTYISRYWEETYLTNKNILK